MSLRGVESPRGVCFWNGTPFTTSYTNHRIYRGEELELFAGSGERAHNDGTLLEASFQNPHGLVGSNGSLFVCDRWNQCIRRICVFVQWSLDTHQQAPRQTRDAVRTLMLMRMRSDSLWNGVPRDIAFLIFAELLAHSTQGRLF